MAALADFQKKSVGASVTKVGASALSGVLIAALFFASWLRGWPGAVFMPYWYLSYSTGFVRRGLIGTFTSPFLVGKPIGNAVVLATLICVTVTITIILLLAMGLANHARRDPLVASAVLAFAASPALMMLARFVGFLDIFLIAAALAAVACQKSDRTIAAAIICVAAPLIHEAFFFFGAPVLAGMVYLKRDRRWKDLAPLLAMAAGTALVWFGASRHVTWANGIPIKKEYLDAFAAWQLTQHAALLGWPTLNPTGALLSVLSVVISAAAAWRLAGARYGIATALGGLFSASIMALGYDYDRFMAWAPVTSLIMMMMAFGTPQPVNTPRELLGAPIRVTTGSVSR